jgi:hypothetical protein
MSTVRRRAGFGLGLSFATLLGAAACGDDAPLPEGDTGAIDQGRDEGGDVPVDSRFDAPEDTGADRGGDDADADAGVDIADDADLGTGDVTEDTVEGDVDAGSDAAGDAGADADDASEGDAGVGDSGDDTTDDAVADGGRDLDATDAFDAVPDAAFEAGLPDGLLPDLFFDIGGDVSLEPCDSIDLEGGTLAPVEVNLAVLTNVFEGSDPVNTGDLYARIATEQFPTEDVIYILEEPGLTRRDWQFTRGQERHTRMCFGAPPGSELYINVVLDRDPRDGLDDLGLEDLEGGLGEPFLTVPVDGAVLESIRVDIIRRGT